MKLNYLCIANNRKTTYLSRGVGLRPARVNVRSRGEQIRATLRNEKGQSVVELAFVLPVLFLVVTGLFTFGLAVNNNLMLTNAVNNGAQLLAISRGQTTDPCATAIAAVTNAAPLLTASSLNFTFVLNGTTYAAGTTSCTAGAANLLQGTTAQVTATYPCNLTVYGVNFAPTCNLQAQTTELVQ
jgi:Flp pilus assembly protein TadG